MEVLKNEIKCGNPFNERGLLTVPTVPMTPFVVLVPSQNNDNEDVELFLRQQPILHAKDSMLQVKRSIGVN